MTGKFNVKPGQKVVEKGKTGKHPEVKLPTDAELDEVSKSQKEAKRRLWHG